MPGWLEPHWLTCILVNGIGLAIAFSVVGSVEATALSGAIGGVNANGQRRGGFMRGLASFGLPLLLASALQIALLVFDCWSVYHMVVHVGSLVNHDWKWYALGVVYILFGAMCLRLPIFRGQEFFV